MSENTRKPCSVLLFDVNETLLDLAPLRSSIERVLPGADSARLWFTTVLQYSVVMTVSGQYAPLPEIGNATLRMLAAGRGATLSADEAAAAIAPITSLPPHPDVRPALSRLRDQHVHMAALSNSTSAGLEQQLAHAGIADLFEAAFSVEQLGKYKPHAEVYRWAAEQMGAPLQDCMLVAAHGWDVGGAAWAGMQTAFVVRGAQRPFPLAPAPDLVVDDLQQLADRLAPKQADPH